LYRLANSMNQGISTLQPPHVVAQKLSNTTLPLYCDNFTGEPVESRRTNPGAAFRKMGGVTAPGSLATHISAIPSAIPALILRDMIHIHGSTHPILPSFLLCALEIGKQELPQLALLECAPDPAAACLIT